MHHRFKGATRINPVTIWRSLILLALAAALMLALGQNSSSTPTPARPNVVIILTDDQTPWHSLEKMKYLSSRDDWVEFKRAFYGNPLCCPSRATLLSGQYSHHTKVEDNSQGYLFDDTKTLATYLDPTYQTAYIGKYLNGYPFGREKLYRPPGWDLWAAEAKGKYIGWKQNYQGRMIEYTKQSEYSTTVLGTQAVNFIKSASVAGEPFFMIYATKAPHGPITPEEKYKDSFKNAPVKFPPSFNEEDRSDKPNYIRKRDKVNKKNAIEDQRLEWEALQSVDDQVENVFNTLESTQQLDNTLVIYMTDNAVGRGEHRLTGKRCPYDECIKNNLLMRIPGYQGQTNKIMTSNADLAPTILDWTNVEAEGALVDGYSLFPALEGKDVDTDRPVILRSLERPGVVDAPTYWGVRTNAYTYTKISDTSEQELYDNNVDPYQLDNLASDPAYKEIKEGLADLTRRLREEQPHSLQTALAGPKSIGQPTFDIGPPQTKLHPKGGKEWSLKEWDIATGNK